MRSANIQVKGLVRASAELVNHSTIVIAGFRVYTHRLAKHRLPFDVCAHTAASVCQCKKSLGDRAHVRLLGIAEGNGLPLPASSSSHVQGFSLLSRSPRETGGSFVCSRHEVYVTTWLIARFYYVRFKGGSRGDGCNFLSLLRFILFFTSFNCWQFNKQSYITSTVFYWFFIKIY